MDRDEIAGLIEPVARELWGEPNRSLSDKRTLRWGNNGGRAVDLGKGTWFDFTENKGGGVLDLVMAEGGAADHKEALRWLEQHGHKQADLRPVAVNGGHERVERPAAARPLNERNIVATYDYRDQSGALIYQVVRLEPKSFVQRQPAPLEDGVWVWGLGAGEYMRGREGEDWRRFDEARWARLPASRQRMTLARPVAPSLYRLPECRDAIEEGATVFLAEGEKDVDNLWELGVPATTNSGGAKHWQSDFAHEFEGAEVRILHDNDRVGLELAEAQARSLYGIARSVKIVSLPGLGDKEDVTDWIGRGGTAEALFALAAAAPAYAPPAFRSAFKAVWFHAIDAEAAVTVDWLVDDLLTAGDRSMIYGRSRSGKSFAAIGIGMAVARGADFLGHKTRRAGVIYQAGEGTKGILNRFRAFRSFHRIDPDEQIPLAILRAPINLYAGDQDTDALIAEIKQLAAQMSDPLGLVVIDTLATATSGADENSARDMSPVLARTARIADATGAHVMLVHHMNAAGERPRGHTGVFANIDNALEVTFDEGTKIRTMRNTKQKDEVEAEPIHFRLRRILLGTRDDGREISSCVCVPLNEEGTPAEERVAVQAEGAFRLNNTEGIFFRALMSALVDNGQAPPPELQLPAGIRTVVNYDEVKRKYARLVLAESDDPKKHAERLKKALQRARENLFSFRIIGVDNPWIWWTGRPVHGFARSQQARVAKAAAEAGAEVIDLDARRQEGLIE